MKTDSKTLVHIDAACDILYSSYYILGLINVFGRKQIGFTSKYFKEFEHNNHFFAFVIEEGGHLKRCIVDFTDSSSISESALQWCDVYGKINLETDLSYSSKIISIGPSFGVKLGGFFKTLFLALTNFILSYKRIPNYRRFFADYKRMFTRPSYRFINQSRNSRCGDYIFFAASLWKQEPETNTYRANFIHACNSINTLTFEGGFAPRSKSDVLGFDDITLTQRIDVMAYFNNIFKSTLVFNTPAVKQCHGWKLAEFLCMGKAILSTPLSRDLPEPLREGETILFTNGSIDDIKQQVMMLISNKELLEHLENCSKAYFECHLAPEAVIQKLIEK